MSYNKRAMALIERMVEQGDVCYFEGGTAADDLLGLIEELRATKAKITKLTAKAAKFKEQLAELRKKCRALEINNP